jgi:hypothetical protein
MSYKRQELLNKRQRKLKGHSRMGNPETLKTLGKHRTKDKQNTTQTTKKTSNTDPTKNQG